jgi:hypothetical protein
VNRIFAGHRDHVPYGNENGYDGCGIYGYENGTWIYENGSEIGNDGALLFISVLDYIFNFFTYRKKI